jgi:hypothetical protein
VSLSASVSVCPNWRRYVSFLARIVSSGNEFASFDLSKVGKAGKGADVKPKEVVGRITIYSGTPGPACGHSVQASSYFDRSLLW